MEPTKVSVTFRIGNTYRTERIWSDRLWEHVDYYLRSHGHITITKVWVGWDQNPGLPDPDACLDLGRVTTRDTTPPTTTHD